MNVTQSTTVAVVGLLEAARGPIPRVWCELDAPQQTELAQCWAKLVHRMRRLPTAAREAEHGRIG